MTRADILDQAKKCVCGDREEDYGSPENNFETIANLWNDYLQGIAADPKRLGISDESTIYIPYLDSVDVAMMMALLKIARVASGRAKDDNFIDLAGYAACGGELMESN